MEKKYSIIQYRNTLESRSLQRWMTLLQFKYHLRKILRSIDRQKFQLLVNQYKDVAPDPGYSKYLDIDKWMQRNLWHVFLLGLNHSKPLSILDIGTGAGYFPYICQYFGHRVISLDIDTDPMFNDLVAFLGVNRKTYRIHQMEKLPDFGTRFDLVTGFMVCFNNHREPDLWTSKEWDFFMRNLITDHLNGGAKAYFTLNAELDTGLYYTDELKNYFLLKGAEIDADRVYFDSLTAWSRNG